MTISSEKNLYEILGISSNASLPTIKAAYRKLVRVYHPDLNCGNKDSAEKFKEIQGAYEILSDDIKRRNYDILNNINTPNYTTTSNYQSRENKKPEFKKQDKEDLFSEFLNEFWVGFKKTTSSYKKYEIKKPKRGADINSEVTISLVEAKNGCTRTVNILHTQACSCGGRTFMNGSTCHICGGKGVLSVHKKITVKIPKNVHEGSKIRISGEGNKGLNGGENGDLYLRIKIENESDFKYEGLNVFYELPITPFEAVLGTNVQIKTPDGNVIMKILPNTQNGQKFRLAKQGLSQNNQKGDMIVTVKIEVPKKLSPQEIALYNQLKAINNTDIRA